MNWNRSGISPVMATVILVAIAIVIAIAVAFWATGLVGIFTRFEKVEIVSAVMSGDTTFDIRVRNTGSADASIDQVIINGKFVGTPDSPITLKVGEMKTIRVTVGSSPPPGITVEIALHSASGKSYPTAILATLGTGEYGEWDPGDITVEEVEEGGGGGGGGGGG